MHRDNFTFTKGSQITGYFLLAFSLVSYPNIKQDILGFLNLIGVKFIQQLHPHDFEAKII
jgi:hypothetical protein